MFGKKIGIILAAFGLTISAEGAISNFNAVADTFINDLEVNNNAGGHTHVAIGTSGNGTTRRGLFRFDVSGIPSGSIVTSATFRIDVIKTPGFNDVNSDFDLLRLLADWTEGNKGSASTSGGGNVGSPASAGEVTWASAKHNEALWVTAGGDAETTASATTLITAVAEEFEWTSTGLVADVQHWIDSPSENFGWLLRTQSEGVARTARQFGSREGLPPRPGRLEVGILISGADSDDDGMPDTWEFQNFGHATNALRNGHADSDGVTNLDEYTADTDPNDSNSVFTVQTIVLPIPPSISVTSSSSRVYGLEYADVLASNVWNDVVTDIPGNGGVLSLRDTNNVAPFRAYRVRVGLEP